MPPKFAATPENVVSAGRIQRGVPSLSAANAMQRPRSPPRIAVTRLISMLFLYASRYCDSNSVEMFAVVHPPVFDLNAPTRIWPAGRSRNANA
jgi:hypothetical protein